MPCYKPLSAYQSLHEDARGKREVIFGNCVDSKGRSCAPILLPCGQCIGCRLERSRQGNDALAAAMFQKWEDGRMKIETQFAPRNLDEQDDFQTYPVDYT